MLSTGRDTGRGASAKIDNPTWIRDVTLPTQNVDQSEIAKFEELASRWWDPGSEFQALHDINPLRLDYIAERAGLAGKRVLDVGCGGGILAESMALRGAQVTGIDASEAALAVARLHQLESGAQVDYRLATAEECAASEPGRFDVVTCMELLEHVPNPASVVEACGKLVNRDGHVFFSTINRTAKAYLFAIIGAEYVLKLLPVGTHEYDKFTRPSELRGWGHEAGLEMVDMVGMHYNPLLRNYWLAPGVEVNYLVHCRAGL
jgi:2-polyprenyl-6-hydroxyphenyl methylase/3-demethylubiquinone-9 3-methyltransferase